MIRFLAIALCLLAAVPAGAEEPAWAPAAVVNGAPYQSVEELRSFYKLTPVAKVSRKGAYGLSLGDLTLELGPGNREMRIGGLLVVLERPLQKDTAGQLLISREDWVKWVDPILRPTYIPGRAPVRTVVIDPAHGGPDEGTPSSYVKEADATLQVALRLQEELEKMGLQVILTRTGDYFLSDRQRVDAANAAESAIFLTLHLNSGRSDYRGSQVYTVAAPEPGAAAAAGNAHDAAQSALAYALQSALVSTAGAADGGCAGAHYSLLSSITCPAVWVELGYATHAQEGAALAGAAYQEALARALARGIATYAHVVDPATSIPVQQPRTTTTPKAPTPAKQPTKTPAKAADTPRTTRSSAAASTTARRRTQPQQAKPQAQPARQPATRRSRR